MVCSFLHVSLFLSSSIPPKKKSILNGSRRGRRDGDESPGALPARRVRGSVRGASDGVGDFTAAFVVVVVRFE